MPLNQNQIDTYVTRHEEREVNRGQIRATSVIVAAQDNALRGLRERILAEGWPKFYSITGQSDKMLAVFGANDIRIIPVESLPGGGPP